MNKPIKIDLVREYVKCFGPKEDVGQKFQHWLARIVQTATQSSLSLTVEDHTDNIASRIEDYLNEEKAYSLKRKILLSDKDHLVITKNNLQKTYHPTVWDVGCLQPTTYGPAIELPDLVMQESLKVFDFLTFPTTTAAFVSLVVQKFEAPIIEIGAVYGTDYLKHIAINTYIPKT